MDAMIDAFRSTHAHAVSTSVSYCADIATGGAGHSSGHPAHGVAENTVGPLGPVRGSSTMSIPFGSPPPPGIGSGGTGSPAGGRSDLSSKRFRRATRREGYARNGPVE